MRLTHQSWTTNYLTVALRGGNLECGNYSRSASLRVHYEYTTDTCPLYKKCDFIDVSGDGKNCTFVCGCEFETCGGVYFFFTNPTDVTFCDAFFVSDP